MLPPLPPPVVAEGSTRSPPVAKDPAGRKGDARDPPLVAEPVEDSLSPCSSGSENSEDSDSSLWKPGLGRGNRGKGSSVVAGKGRKGGSDEKGSRDDSNGVVRPGEGESGDDDDGDEADEDIHARLANG